MFSEKTRQLIAEEMEREYLQRGKVQPFLYPQYIFQDLNALQRFWRVFCRKVLRFDPYPPIRVHADSPRDERLIVRN